MFIHPKSVRNIMSKYLMVRFSILALCEYALYYVTKLTSSNVKGRKIMLVCHTSIILCTVVDCDVHTMAKLPLQSTYMKINNPSVHTKYSYKVSTTEKCAN